MLLPEVWVGRSCRLRRCIIDRACVIPEGMVIGENAEEDARRFYVQRKVLCWSRVKCYANCRSNRSDNAGFTRLFRDVPPVKNRGLADVIGALPAAQIADGVDARVLLPAFPDIRRGIPDAQVVTRRDTFAGRITLLFGHFNGVGIYLIDAPHLYDRPVARITTLTWPVIRICERFWFRGLVQCLLAPGKGLTHSALGLYVG
ncbi:glycogen synthase [Escherichia coli]|nr:glycogen synthase [Escherichia coli]